MAYALTERTKNALNKDFIEPNMVLEIEGVAQRYAIRSAKSAIRFDAGLNFDDGLFFDGLATDNSQSDLISLSGTTSSISSQLEPDKGAASSTQTLTISLIDVNEQISQLVSPGVIIPDIMYRNCTVYFGLYETSFPDDYIEIFNGKVMGITPKAGTIDLIITHPDDLKRSSIFEKVDRVLTEVVDFDSSTIQDLFYQKRSDVDGVVSITYTTSSIGPTANVSVIGNDITVGIDFSATTAKILKKKIEAHEDASQLVDITITGTPTNAQVAQAQTFLASDTEVFVDDIRGFFLPTASPLFKTYVKIEDEIIQYTGIDTSLNKFTGCTRQALTSFGATHDLNTQVSSFYKLGDASSTYGGALDLALYLLLSGSDLIFGTESVTQIVTVPDLGDIPNALYLPGVYLSRDLNVVAGDLGTLAGSGANDFIDRTIISVTEIAGEGTYVMVDGSALTPQTGITAVLTVKSQYNILPDGAGLLPHQVDLAQFHLLKSRFPTAVVNYELLFKDTVNVKDMINTQIFLPSALYSVPRKGKISVGITAPPLYDANSQMLTIDNIKSPAGLKLERSVAKNFYNAIAYKYNQDSVTDTYLNKFVTVSADSINRIDAPAKTFLIEADGLRPSVDNTDIISRNSNRFLDRYKYGAEAIKVPVLFKTGFGVEVGDSILFGDSNLYLTDTKKGSKDFSPRLMEVLNKEWNWKTGDIVLSLLDTTYSNDFRFGVFSPSSDLGSGSTASSLKIVVSNGTQFPAREKDKWDNYLGREIKVHSEDWTFVENTYLQGFDPGDDSLMLVDPPLSVAPGEGYIVDIVDYAGVDPLEGFYKNVHCFWTPQVDVVSGASQTSFNVSSAAHFFIGSLIRVHNYDYSIDSGETAKRVTAIAGVTITCDDLGFVPNNTMFVDLIGFVEDEGKPYTWL